MCKYFPLCNEDSLPPELANNALEELRHAESKNMLLTIMSDDLEKVKLITVGEHFMWLIEAVRILLQSSVETGNPIIWDIIKRLITPYTNSIL